jgi:hypothetical protein
MEKVMGKKRAQLMSKDAFSTVFVQAEMVMRKTLSDKIQDLIERENNADVKAGLQQAQTIIFGVKE